MNERHNSNRRFKRLPNKKGYKNPTKTKKAVETAFFLIRNEAKNIEIFLAEFCTNFLFGHTAQVV
jgi:hypothetical protein